MVQLVILLDDVGVEAGVGFSVGHGLLEGVLHDLLEEDVEVGLEFGAVFEGESSLSANFLLIFLYTDSEDSLLQTVSQLLKLRLLRELRKESFPPPSTLIFNLPSASLLLPISCSLFIN